MPSINPRTLCVYGGYDSQTYFNPVVCAETVSNASRLAWSYQCFVSEWVREIFNEMQLSTSCPYENQL